MLRQREVMPRLYLFKRKIVDYEFVLSFKSSVEIALKMVSNDISFAIF